MTTRRQFLAYGGGTALALFACDAADMKRTVTEVPGGTLDPMTVPGFATPLLVPPVMPRAGTIRLAGGKNADYYEISMRQFRQQILPAGLPTATVWGYGPVAAQSRNALLIHNAPSLTIEAQFGWPVRVKWINELVDARGRFLPHLLPVDPTLHWADPPGGAMHRDTRPPFTSTPGPYTGPVPIVTHVHGAAGVGDEGDGDAEAWYLPAITPLPPATVTRRLALLEEVSIDFDDAPAENTVIAYPGEVTRIEARFAAAGQYVWHCHTVEHEDNEMMRPYRIGPLRSSNVGCA